MEILVNHIGYEKNGRKVAVVAGTGGDALSPASFFIIEKDGEEIFRGSPGGAASVPGWKGRIFYHLDFTDVETEGNVSIVLNDSGRILKSCPFCIGTGLLAESCISDILFYFKSQRATWRWDKADSNVPFFGSRKDRVNLSGGWYDASGDYSKYLSHLSYANYMNPQQTPLVVWALLKLRDSLEDNPRYGGTLLEERALEEGLFGADFLVRMQDPEGYFYMTLFDQWSKDTAKRQVAAFRGKEGVLMDNYQAGFRQGGGIAVAALAKAARFRVSGMYKTSEYLMSAVKGWDHLVLHNKEYLDNGKENIIDSYCALTAAVELFRTTGDDKYLAAARERFADIERLYDPDKGCWAAEDGSDRPYFHAAEAGFPFLAVSEYLSVESDEALKSSAAALIKTAAADMIRITGGREDNPFALAKQWVKAVDGNPRVAFFVPHNNESGYWWQGENARLASLSCAARTVLPLFDGDAEMTAYLEDFADAQLHWILGRNPYDMCMLQGHGRNNPRYEDHYPNAPGGICNGITSGFEDEDDIDFLPASLAGRGDHRWRWSEQWIPHAAWFLLALCADSGRWRRK